MYAPSDSPSAPRFSQTKRNTSSGSRVIDSKCVRSLTEPPAGRGQKPSGLDAPGTGIDAVAPEAGDQMPAESVLRVVRTNLVVGSHQRAEEVGELDVDGRRVVERANRHRQQVVGALGGLFRDALAVEELPSSARARSRSTITPMNAFIIAATRISPRRCGS